MSEVTEKAKALVISTVKGHTFKDARVEVGNDISVVKDAEVGYYIASGICTVTCRSGDEEKEVYGTFTCRVWWEEGYFAEVEEEELNYLNPFDF